MPIAPEIGIIACCGQGDMMKAREAVSWLAGAALDIVMPPLCLSCAAGTDRVGGLCPGCWSKLSFIDEPRCAMWGEPLAYDAGEGVMSARAIARPAPWRRLAAAVLFNDQAARLVHALKYHDRIETAELLARLIYRAGRQVFGEDGVIVPVPLHRFRLWRRRYNQAALLASSLAELCGLAYEPEILVRRKRTRSQVGLPQTAREANVRKAFSVPVEAQSEITGRRVVLVDDVLTTGSTLFAATECLLKAGARQVDAAVFALVPMPGQGHI
jgi:ComF family protein